MTKIVFTRKRKNPFLATSEDGKNMAFGKTRAEAQANLEAGIASRTN